MRVRHYFTWLLLVLLAWPQPGAAYYLRDEAGKPRGAARATDFFRAVDLPTGFEVRTDPRSLLAVARGTLAYLEAHPEDTAAVHGGMPAELGLTLDETRRTLRALATVLEADVELPRAKQRITTEDFVRRNFRALAWRSDTETARRYKVNIPPERIRLTQYVVYRVEGRPARAGDYAHALYGLPDDEQGLKAPEAEQRRGQLWRYKLTKQQVVAGAYDPGGAAAGRARPLVWLTRAGLEHALLQGTIVVRVPGQAERTFNVHRNNGIAYDRSLKDTRLQRRYWYFREVDGIKGYGNEIENKITVMPGVTFAGDVYNLGLGKLVAIEAYDPAVRRPVMRLGVLADTGGAFTPNLYQLDYLSGIFDSPADFQRASSEVPPTVRAFLLIAR